jgi:hypothetical protein
MDPTLAAWQIVEDLAAIVAGAAAFVAPSYIVIRWILAPIDRAAKFHKAPARYSVGDFLCLFLAIQIPLAAIYRFIPQEVDQPFWEFTVATWIVGPLMWMTGARTLSKAGIVAGAHRFVYMGLIMPLVYYGFLPLTFLGVAMVALAIEGPEPGGMPGTQMLLAWAVLAGLFAVSGVYTRYILRQAISDSTDVVDAPPAARSEPRLRLDNRVPIRLTNPAK